jgi:WD40 repeat protein
VFLTDGTVQRFDLLTGEEDAQIKLPTPLNQLAVCALAYPSDQAFPTYATQTGLFSYREDQQRFMEEEQTGFCGAPQLASAEVLPDGGIFIEEAGMTLFTDALQPYRQSISSSGEHLILQEGRYNNFTVQVRSLPEELSETWVKPLTDRSYAFNPIRASHFDSQTGEMILVDAAGLINRNGQFQQLQLNSAVGLSAAEIASNGDSVLVSLADGQVLYYSDPSAPPDVLVESKAGRSNPSRAVAFSQDDGLKAAGDDQGNLRVWDANNQLTVIETDGGAVQDLLFSPEDDYLAVRGTGYISVWQITHSTEGILLEQLPQTMTGTLMAFSPQGTRFVTASQKNFHHPVNVWDFPALDTAKSFDLPITAVDFVSEDRFYAISTGLWICNLGESCRTIELPETFTMGDLTIAPDESEAIVITTDGRVVKIVLTTE